jgi:hypothetical protein
MFQIWAKNKIKILWWYPPKKEHNS